MDVDVQLIVEARLKMIWWSDVRGEAAHRWTVMSSGKKGEWTAQYLLGGKKMLREFVM